MPGGRTRLEEWLTAFTGESGKMTLNSKRSELDYCPRKCMRISCKFILQTAMTTRFREPPIRPCRDEIKENVMIYSVLRRSDDTPKAATTKSPPHTLFFTM